MTDEGVNQTPTIYSSKERAALVAKALGEAARRARFSTKRRKSMTSGGFRARRGERLFKLLRFWSFILVFVVPTVLGAIYFGLIASDQYTAEARFTVRGGLPPAIDSIGSLTGAPSILIIQDTQIIINYIESRALVETLQKEVDVEALYQRSSVDYFSRLETDLPIEKVVKYWKKHIELSVQMPAGIVVFTVKAFTPKDAVKIADAALASSEDLVNRMNDQMRNDAVSLANAESRRSLDHLAIARADLEKARNSEGMLSAEEQSSALTGLMTKLRGEMIKMQQDYDSQRRYVRADAPQLRSLQSKIQAANGELAKLQAQATDAKSAADGTSRVLSGSMSRLDYANLESEIAEKIYAGSLAAVEHAKLASETKLMYINTFVKPVAAEEAKYPRRGLDILLVALACFALWGAIVGALAVARTNLT